MSLLCPPAFALFPWKLDHGGKRCNYHDDHDDYILMIITTIMTGNIDNYGNGDENNDIDNDVATVMNKVFFCMPQIFYHSWMFVLLQLAGISTDASSYTTAHTTATNKENKTKTIHAKFDDQTLLNYQLSNILASGCIHPIGAPDVIFNYYRKQQTITNRSILAQFL